MINVIVAVVVSFAIGALSATVYWKVVKED